MKMRFAGLVLGAVLAAGGAQASQDQAFTLTVNVSEASSTQGTIRADLFDDPEEFPSGTPLAEISGPADQDGRATLTFNDVAPGTYAISLYHDENANEKLDRDSLGIPEEKFGFSNNADIDFNAPRFFEAQFEITEDTTLEIRLKSWE